MVDLGTGTGMIAFASSLILGSYSIGIDIDERQLVETVHSQLYGVLLVDFVQAYARHLPLRRASYCVLQNPPFGVHRKGADVEFLRTASMLGAELIVSIHKDVEGALGFLEARLKELGYRIVVVEHHVFPIRATY
ncbi:METTL5 family protein [Hyperthermus butylicus]|uniref:Uncharacterized protein n=1 Tax=Hyperthermus butylicus (strain DSM 5456 / JCM 9403 / PLM1-5) TaxID=415426 RepID=A2BNA4_HYPBU|nr:hypothetical protein [Hyperthermus butylicus]ABM81465.1 hypothetical protein Hbut_1651 [Hyperthermus butylicus DSM 5456]